MGSDIGVGQAQQVAIVGAACRLPGGIVDLDGLWQALLQARNLVSEAPADRFDRERFVDSGLPRPGKSYTAAGGFLDDVASFDADFFGITPKEASRMDPQHRLLLELAVEALDDAGMSLRTLAGSDTAVYVGLSDASYGALQAMQAREVNAYTMTGGALSLAANRLSHFLDVRGPSMAIDTACSSSLVALDRACRTLQEGTSRVALSAGANVLLNPYHYVGLSQASMLSPTGRCAPFSAAADGFVRAEGGGVVVLKRLRDALADGDRIHGVIVGSGANNDGHTPGVALPNPEAQEGLLRQVYAEAGVEPEELAYLEAHGTGTLVGDPAECRSIGRALGARRDTVLPIGSVKSNVGHMESASGMAGLLKALLVLRHQTVPATLHTLPANPDIDFAALNVAPVAEATPLQPSGRSVVGVNSFGFGGTNAHVIVAAPPAPGPDVLGSRGGAAAPRPVTVSARCPQALREATARLSEHLVDADPAGFYDLAYTGSRRRELHRHRAVVLAGTPQEAAQRLAGLFAPSADGEDGRAGASAPARGAEVSSGAVGEAVPGGRVAFVFSGNGSQWAGMGADLLAADSVFREAVHAVDAVLSTRLGWSVADRLPTVTAEEMEATEVAQPLLFVVQVAVAAVLRERGVIPAAVIGHSVGEVAAAHVAGALSLEQAARVIAERSRAQASTAGSGRMAAVAVAPEQAEDVLVDYPGVELAAVNSTGDVTVAGPEKEVLRLAADLAHRETACTVLELDYAFHSAAMDPLRASLCEALHGLAPAPTSVPLFSTVTGEQAEGAQLGAVYWWRNVRETVRFQSAVRAVFAEGVDVLVEVGPHPVLRSYLRRSGGEQRTPVAVVPTLRRGACGTVALRRTTEAVMAAGGEIDWNVHFPQPGRVADLPAYPWQRSVHWQGSAQDWVRTSGTGVLDHPLLGERMPGPHPVWHGAVEPQLVPWLVDHRIAGSVVVPAAGYVEMVMAAGQRSLGGPVEVDRMHLIGPLAVPWGDASSVHMQLAVNPEDGRVTITSTDEHSREPRPHVRARVRARLGASPDRVDVPVLRQRCTRHHRADDYYAALNRKRLEYGPAFRVLTELRAGNGEVLAEYEHHADAAAFTVHPALLDGALQSGALLLVDKMTDEETGYLPSAIGSVKVWRTPSSRGFFHVRERSFTHAEVCWDITVMDDDGTVTVELESCRLRRFTHPDQTPVLRHHTEMRAAPLPGTVASPSPLPSPAQLVSACGRQISAHLHAAASLRVAAAITLMKRFRAHQLAEAAARALPDPRAPFTLTDLTGAGVDTGFIAAYGHALGTDDWREVAEPVGGGAWRLTAAPQACAVAQELVRDHALFGSDLLLLSARAGAATGQLGQGDVLELPSGGGVTAALEQFFDTSPACRTYNRVCQALVRELVRCWPADRPLRVMEVGAGTGGMTNALLPLLPTDRTTYLVTDPSSSLVHRAQQRLVGYDFVRYATYELDGDPAGQEVAEGGFDLVVAANALHTSKDLASAVRRVATLLAPGGYLLAFESHSADALAPVVGLLDGFSRRRTDHQLRPDSALLPGAAWPPLLEQCGFTEVAQVCDETGPLGDDFSVLLATAASSSRRGAAAMAPQEPQPATRSTVVLATETPGEEALAAAVQDHLAAPGRQLVRAEAVTTAAEWQRAIGAPETDVHLVLLLGEVSPDNAALVPCAARRAACLRAMAQACTRLPADSRAWIWLITRPSGSLPHPEQPTTPVDAAAWGAARTLANEYPDLRVRRVSLARSSEPDDDARRLADELRACGEEDEVALTGAGRFVPRVLPLPATTRRLPECYALSVRRPGLSYELAWQETPRPAPGPGEAVVEVRATALNYRDIMTVTSLLPPEAQEVTRTTVPGLECAGVVTAVGDQVTSLRAGDRVYGPVDGSFASHILTSAEFLQPIPDGMTFEAAATLPICFATVHHTLANLAHVREGETVLVHGGAGGIGLAVLQFAALHKAQVIATAGSDAKRALLHALGVQHVLDSRSLDFAYQVKQLTQGRGVDVVVNSLAGEALSRSLELLRPGGRFIELGKLDIFDNNPLALRPFLNNLAFFGFDLTGLREQPDVARALAKQVARHGQAGHYRPLLHSVYPASRVHEAFDLMQHSRHIGKVVVAFDPHDEPPAVEPLPRHVRLDPEGTYLITGGLSGFGAATARWLTERGARHLALVSRRGPDTPEAPALLEELAHRGVQARAYRADVTDEHGMRTLLDSIDAGTHRLRGVVHCAMHLDDAPLEELTDARFSAVLAPKMEGAAVLDRLTRGRDMDLFLLFSSASADIGNIHQAPYVSGNLYLEALCRQRRQAKLPAQTIAWGSLDETGYVARNNLTAQLAAVGMKPLALKDAFAAADDILTRGFPVAGAGHYNWDRARGLLPLIATPRYSLIVPSYEEISGRPREEFLASLAGLSPAQARETLQKAVTQNLAKAMQMEPEALDPHRRLDEYGLDSLMATELLASVRQQFNVVIPPMELLRSGTTIHDLTTLLHLRLGFGEPPTPASATSGTSSLSRTIPDQPAGPSTPDSLAPAKAAPDESPR